MRGVAEGCECCGEIGSSRTYPGGNASDRCACVGSCRGCRRANRSVQCREREGWASGDMRSGKMNYGHPSSRLAQNAFMPPALTSLVIPAALPTVQKPRELTTSAGTMATRLFPSIFTTHGTGGGARLHPLMETVGMKAVATKHRSTSPRQPGQTNGTHRRHSGTCRSNGRNIRGVSSTFTASCSSSRGNTLHASLGRHQGVDHIGQAEQSARPMDIRTSPDVDPAYWCLRC